MVLTGSSEALDIGRRRAEPVSQAEQGVLLARLAHQLPVGSEVRVINATAESALDVEVRVYGIQRDGEPVGPYGTSRQIPVLSPGDEEELRITTQDIRQVSRQGPVVTHVDQGGHPITPEGGYYSYKQLHIVAEWKSLLGAVASVAYIWYGNAPGYDHRWRLREAAIRPWGDDADEVIVKARD